VRIRVDEVETKLNLEMKKLKPSHAPPFFHLFVEHDKEGASPKTLSWHGQQFLRPLAFAIGRLKYVFLQPSCLVKIPNDSQPFFFISSRHITDIFSPSIQYTHIRCRQSNE